MKVIELFSKALEHESMWELVDHLAVERLKESRELLIEDRDRLTKIADVRDLPPHQQKDWDDTIILIAAFNRVIEYYGGE
jgi:enhancing lycopene biosynthesis protein 2